MTISFSRGAARALLVCLVLTVVAQVSLGLRMRALSASLLVLGLSLWVAALFAIERGLIGRRCAIVAMSFVVAACVAFPPATSKDVNSYALYGRMVANYDRSPYTHVPRDFPSDPWYERVSYYWNDSPTVYGPLFTGMSAGIMKWAGTSFDRARLAFQLLEAVALLAVVVLVVKEPDGTLLIALVGLNPLLLAFGVNDAHCDLLVGLAVLAAAVMSTRRHWTLAGVAMALAVMIKISALPAVLGLLLWAYCRRGGFAALRVGIGAAIASSIGFVISGGTDMLSALQEASSRHTRFSVWAPLHGLLTTWLGDGPPTRAPADHIVGAVASATVALVGVVMMWRHRGSVVPFVALAAGLVTYQVLGAYTLSWYLAWSLPVLAYVWRSPIAFVAMLHAALIAIAYLSGYVAICALVAAVVAVIRQRRKNGRLFPWMQHTPEGILGTP